MFIVCVSFATCSLSTLLSQLKLIDGRVTLRKIHKHDTMQVYKHFLNYYVNHITILALSDSVASDIYVVKISFLCRVHGLINYYCFVCYVLL